MSITYPSSPISNEAATVTPVAPLLVVPQFFTSREPLQLQSGQSLPEFTLAYETYGQPNADRSNVILVLHGLSGDAHAAGVYAVDDDKPGWWDLLIGPGKVLDTDRYWVISSHILGGCKGSTGPSSINPESGKPYSMDFPVVTIGDMVEAQKRLLDHLEVSQLYVAIGGSLGGFQVLEWARRYPAFVRKAASIASGPQLSAEGIGFNTIGRQAIMQDPNWERGEYYGSGKKIDGLAIARMLAHITYLSEDVFNRKFGRQLKAEEALNYTLQPEFNVEFYLEYQGKKFSESFDANSYLYLTKAMDYYDAGQGFAFEEAFADSKAEFLNISFSSDRLFPAEASRQLDAALKKAGKRSAFHELETSLGHDAFLIKNPPMEGLLRDFLS